MRSHGSKAIMRPVAVSPYAWPARPIRWRPLATDLGDPIWTTRSMYPMSMPSSRDVEVEGLAGVDLDDVHVADLAVREAGEELRLLLDRRDRGAQPDADEVLTRLLPQTLEANRQEGSALRRADLVDLVEDDPLDVRKVLAELRGAKDDCDALRRRDEDMRRPSDLPLSFLGRRVPGPHAHADLRLRFPLLLRQGRELLQGLLEVSVDVVREGLQRRDIEAIDPVLQFAAELLRVQLVDD